MVLFLVATAAAAPGDPRHLGTSLNIFSLGVADINADGRLDIYTVNHAFDGPYLLNEGGLVFRDARAELGLSGNPDFPRAEISTAAPVIAAPGLYLYWQDDAFHLLSHRLDYPAPLTVRLTLNGGILPTARGRIDVREHHDDPDSARLPTRMTAQVACAGSPSGSGSSAVKRPSP